MLTDPIILEAILRTLRVLMCVTGALVLIDSIGILVLPTEHPPHKPKWAAISWCIVAGSTSISALYLLNTKAGLVGENDPVGQQFSIYLLYLSLTAGFTLRAVSRAHRPLFTIIAVLGMSVAGVVFALWDLMG